MTKISDEIVAKALKEHKTPEELVAFARGLGRTDEQIIKDATINKSAKEVAAFARKFGQALGKTFGEIRTIAGPRS